MRIFAILMSFFIVGGCTSFGGNSKELAQLHMAIGTQHFERGQYAFALKELLEAERLDSSNYLIMNNLGLVYFVRLKYDLAEKYFRSSLSQKKDFSDARNNLARTLAELKKYSEAEKEIKIVLEDLTYPSQDRAYLTQGYIFYAQEKWASAEKSFIEAIKINRENCSAQTYLGKTYFEKKDYDQAQNQLERAISFCQKNLIDEPHYYSALTLFRRGLKEESKKKFEEVIQIYPGGQYHDKAKAMIELIEKGVE